MTDFDFDASMEMEDAPTGDFQEAPRRKLVLWDVLTAVTLLLTVCLIGYFAMVFFNPYTPLNPLRPPTPITPLALPTATWTPLPLAPTWTPTATVPPTPTNTPRPTWTPYNLPSGMVFSPTPSPTATLSPTPTGMPFTVSITPIESTIIHPDSGCNWLGVGGEASDLNNSPVLYLIVRLGGTLAGETVDLATVTGIAPDYGRAGFEFVLADHPIASNKTLWIQLFDQAGLPLSNQIRFSTYDDCTKNLILIRFKKVR